MYKATPAEIAKYADHSVSVHESKRRRSVGTAQSDKSPILIYMTGYRIPSLKQFEVFVRSDATPEQRRTAVSWAASLPSGGWCEMSPLWYRTKRRGHVAWWQSVGRSIEDPLIELEVEDFRDNDVDMELQALLGASA